MRPKLDFRNIAARNGSQDDAFEEFCCQIARRDSAVPAGSEFVRFRGAGGDGGVECLWRQPDGSERGLQAKYMFDLSRAKAALDESVATAIKIHPRLTHYTICLPFDLTGPTGKTKRDGTPALSQKERFDEYRKEWEAFARAQGVNLTITLETASTLLDSLLQFDPNGGRLSFWFDATVLGDDWFAAHLDEATRSAQPRYTPQLRVGTPTAVVFEAVGRTEGWRSSVRERVEALDEVCAKWRSALAKKQHDPAVSTFPPALRPDGEQCLGLLEGLVNAVRRAMDRPPAPTAVDAIRGQMSVALEGVAEIESALAADIDAQFGPGKANSPNFRQFEAEYNVRFPASHLDRARDVQKVLNGLVEWYADPVAKLPGASTLILLGPAGAGKTHATCDAAHLRAEAGLRTVVLFGERFGSAFEPWENVRQLLGLPATLGRDALLAALDAAGEAAGYPLLICIDGLNETKPRTYWKPHLAAMAAQVSRYPWLRLCITCRSGYEPVVVPRATLDEAAGTVRVTHQGFAGMEADACREFFAHYGLEPPPTPALHAEFSNPLFLRLLCEAMKAAGIVRLPSGWLGLSKVIKAFIRQKNELYATQHDQLPSHRVPERGLQAILSEMERCQSSALSFDAAAEAVDGAAPASTQRSLAGHLLDWLVREGLLILDADPEGDEYVRIAFERLGDHLLADRMVNGMRAAEDVRGAFASGGTLHRLVADEAAIQGAVGLIEALAIQVPERFGVELLDCLPFGAGLDALGPDATHDQQKLDGGEGCVSLIRAAVVTALPWRDPAHLSERTGEILRDDLATRPAAFDTALAVGLQPSPIDAFWFHETFLHWRQASRDSFWCPYLHLNYEDRGQVYRLIHAAFSIDANDVPEAVRERWATLFLWFCAASDQRVRDFATKALVTVTEPQPVLWARLVGRFTDVNDDYVVERCLASAYGSLLRTQDPDAIRRTATVVYDSVFAAAGGGGFRFQNAQIRDHGRCILELAEHHGCLPDGVARRQYLPPYRSDWPLAIKSPAELGEFKGDSARAPRLYASCFDDDFFTYTLGRLGSYLEGKIDRQAAARWIFGHVVFDMEYLDNPELARFDRHLWSKYGAGRGRMPWAERIGKKYQRIALARLAARLADHVKPKRDRWDPKPKRVPLSFDDGRDIDPSMLVRFSSQDDEVLSWWIPKSFAAEKTVTLRGKAWVESSDDLPDLSELVAPKTAPDGSRWTLLAAHPRWSDPRETRDTGTYRVANVQILSHLVPEAGVESFWKWLSQATLDWREVSAGAEFSDGYAGEYPFATIFNVYEDDYFSHGTYASETKGASRLIPTGNRLLCESDDAYQEGHIAYRLPARAFFDHAKLSWNGTSGYSDAASGRTVLWDPSLTQSGPEALLAEEAFLEAFLQSSGYRLFWTVVGEKISMKKSRWDARLTFSQALRSEGGVIRCTPMRLRTE
jgi:hypothetical protein